MCIKMKLNNEKIQVNKPKKILLKPVTQVKVSLAKKPNLSVNQLLSNLGIEKKNQLNVEENRARIGTKAFIAILNHSMGCR